MNLQILSLIGLAVLTSSVTSGLHHPLVIDYLKSLKNSRYVTTFACSAESETLTLSRKIFDLNIKHNYVDLRLREYSLKELLFYKAPGEHVVIVDCSCPNHMNVLLQASESKYFNLTYNWFLVYEAVDVDDIQTILDPVKGIAINSQFTFAKITENGTAYNLFDIWSYGRHLGSPIQCVLYAIWRKGKGIEVTRKLGPMFGKNNRGNLHGLTLRGVTVIDKDDVTPDDVDPIVSRIGLSDGISPFVRYHYFLIKILMDRYNFTLKYRIARAWAGRLPSGYRLGLLGIVQRDEADVAATGVFPRINRHDDFDFYHSSWKFEAAFLFRVTPDLVNSKGGGSFLIPFSNDVWLLICLSLVFIILWLKIISFCCKQCLGQQGQEFFDFIVDAIGGIAQQGLNTTSNFVPVRIVLIHLLIMTLLLYNYYTYFVVGGLLSSPPKGPENVRELIESTLSVSFEDIGYHKILFRESNSSIVKELQRKKLQGVRKALPVYVSVANVIPYLRQGGYSFHSETTVTYNEISKNFKANEICELRMIPGVMETNMMVMIQPKNNMYTEMFKIEMLRALEAGLVKKWLHTIKYTKPECQAGATVHPVAIDGVLAAFYILIFGGILAIIILIAEKLNYKYNFKLDLVYEGYLP